MLISIILRVCLVSMAIRLKLTKKWKIIVIIFFVLILGGSGGYLLWRTNQPETVAPTDSEATGGAGACCNPKYGCVAGWKCKTGGCNETLCVDEETCPFYKGIQGTKTGKCKNDPWAGKTKCDYKFAGTCVRETDPGGPSEGDCKDTKCTWPKVVMSDNNCACELCNGSNGCSGDPPKCQPAACPSGYEDCGTTAEGGHDASGCVKQEDKFCTVYHKDCNNPSTIYRYCKKKDTSSNTCDGGEWLTKPTGKYKYCDPITYMAKAKDKDGIDATSVVSKLNSVKRTKVITNNSTETSLIITDEPLSTATECLPVGDYTLNLSWKDKKGASSTACTLSTTFKILEEDVPEVYPEWSITKTGAEQCIESGDAQVRYTIKVKNSGEGAGNIEKIVDVLDSKVLASYISGTISEEGLFGSGKITWTIDGPEGGGTFAPGQERTYTYTLVIPKTAFGTYTNTVTAYPTGENEEDFSDTLEVTVDCEQDIPQTGLFDSTIAKIVAGIILLLLGFNLHRIDTSFRRVENSLHKLSVTIQDSQDERRKRNFEKKIVKK